MPPEDKHGTSLYSHMLTAQEPTQPWCVPPAVYTPPHDLTLVSPSHPSS